MGSGRFESFMVASGESDLWVGYNFRDGISGSMHDPARLRNAAQLALEAARAGLVAYAQKHPAFLESLEPLPADAAAPPVVTAMLDAGLAAGVGPMAAVAGAVAEAVGRSLYSDFELEEIVVENGGDLWIQVRSPLWVTVYAGLSSLSEKVAVELNGGRSIGLACSSGTVGPSLSSGRADAAIVLAENAALADAWATALGNRIHNSGDLEPAVATVVAAAKTSATKPAGALVILGDRMAAAGDIRLGPGYKH
jgi:ApbE superfamily uncharacterized protein (UPF0280 family)